MKLICVTGESDASPASESLLRCGGIHAVVDISNFNTVIALAIRSVMEWC